MFISGLSYFLITGNFSCAFVLCVHGLEVSLISIPRFWVSSNLVSLLSAILFVRDGFCLKMIIFNHFQFHRFALPISCFAPLISSFAPAIALFCTVWDKLTCSRPIRKQKLLLVYYYDGKWRQCRRSLYFARFANLKPYNKQLNNLVCLGFTEKIQASGWNFFFIDLAQRLGP